VIKVNQIKVNLPYPKESKKPEPISITACASTAILEINTVEGEQVQKVRIINFSSAIERARAVTQSNSNENSGIKPKSKITQSNSSEIQGRVKSQKVTPSNSSENIGKSKIEEPKSPRKLTNSRILSPISLLTGSGKSSSEPKEEIISPTSTGTSSYVSKVNNDVKQMLEKSLQLELSFQSASVEEQENIRKEWDSHKDKVLRKVTQLQQLKERLPVGSVPTGTLDKASVEAALESTDVKIMPAAEKRMFKVVGRSQKTITK